LLDQARPSRVIAHVRGTEPGPTLILVGGLHGNEPAGIVAALSVLATLPVTAVRGEVIALVGNARAVAAGKRYIDRDLNRLWLPERLAAREQTGEVELAERAELADAIERVRERAVETVYVVDMHTTSAQGFPFVVVGPTEAHRAFAAKFPLCGIRGLAETLEGTLLRYLGDLGCVTLAIEGGQSATTLAAANLEAVVTLALEAARVVDAPPGVTEARAHLEQARADLPHAIEVVSRHHIDPFSDFVMEPGFTNIQRTAAGTLLAKERAGEVRAPFDGFVLLPLYQAQGDSGFFYGREVT
jgi:succinylglutamate desuccinylase